MAALTRIRLPFGHGEMPIDVPSSNLVGIFSPQPAVTAGGPQPAEAALVRRALRRPIGTARLRDLAWPGQQVAIVTSDLTRPCPSHTLLPPVLDELAAAGIASSDITIVIALGLHRPM
ncbi:MAG TPA: lactate racemase domain-containing protein, partial [Anaerolineae bacterium]|nr:lactate racemase domain-containing protein [Anaerolineae bacterium]